MMDTLLQDLRYAFRSLLKHPGFLLVSGLTLALGIGASTAIFGVTNGVLLRPLPYDDPDRIVRIWNQWEDSPEAELSPAEYFDYREQVGAFASMGVYAAGPVNLTGDDAPERLTGAYLSAGVFPTLGVAPLHGRVFLADEDLPGTDAVAVLGHGLWSRRYGADPAVVGRRILVDGREVTVIGVMPEGFRLPDEIRSGEAADLYLPLGLDRASVPNRGSHFLSAIARLRPGVTQEQATASIAAVAERFVRGHPDDYPTEMRFGARTEPLADSVVGGARPALLLLLGAVGVVLLIACVNVASLLLIRADGRQKEMAVRMALGAGRGRLARQLFLECGILALIGGAGGVLVAVWATDLLAFLDPPSLPRGEAIGVDARVLAFALVVSFVAALLFGMAPVLQLSRPAIQGVLRENGRGATATAGRQRFRAILVASEVALAVVLLLGAGLLVRSFQALGEVDPGYRTGGLITMQLSLPPGEYGEQEQVVAFYQRLLEGVSALPAVAEAGAVTNLPLASSLGDLNFQLQGQPTAEGDVSPRADWQVVTPGYFSAMGMRLVRGRGIAAGDDERGPGVVVLNESAARRYWPAGDAIGQRLLLGGGAAPGWVTVVGIVGDVRHATLREDPRPEMYLPHAQFRFWNDGGPVRTLTLAVHTTGDPAASTAAIREQVRAIDRNVPISDIRTMEEVRAESVAESLFMMLLVGAFSTVALALAAIGVYGTLAYSVVQRTTEIGIRMALGAHAREVRRMVVRRGLRISMAGVLVGVVVALGVTRLLAAFLYGVGAADPVTFAAVAALLLAVSALASYFPARRATRVDPMVALRAE